MTADLADGDDDGDYIVGSPHVGLRLRNHPRLYGGNCTQITYE